jgi:uncharacterized protein YggE
MNLCNCAASMVVMLFCSMASKAQSVQVNQQNRTIEIAANSSIEVTADRVTITAGITTTVQRMTPLSVKMLG